MFYYAYSETLLRHFWKNSTNFKLSKKTSQKGKPEKDRICYFVPELTFPPLE